MSDFLTQSPKTTSKSKKRLGRGYASGKGGHTTIRGQKGQKSRSKIPLLFTGTKAKKSLIQRLPKLRGRGKFKSLNPKLIIIPIKDLNQFPKGTEIDLNKLIETGMVSLKDARVRGVKILNQGQLTKSLKINLPVSQSAKQQIEAVGGKIITNQ